MAHEGLKQFSPFVFMEKQGKYKAEQGKPPIETRFKPGKTGNPNGRPKKLPAIDKLMAEVLGSIDGKDSEAQSILEALAKRAKKGDVRAAEVLLDRGYGKAKQTTEVILPEDQIFVIGGREIKF